MQAIFSWQTLWYLILVLYIPACLGLIVVVLLQKGKGVGFAGATPAPMRPAISDITRASAMKRPAMT